MTPHHTGVYLTKAQPRYYVQESTIGWQVRDREQGCVVEWPGGWAIYKKRADAGHKAKELNAALTRATSGEAG